MPKISVIVPIYNVEKYLEKCIDSILTQTFVDFECILIDDGSSDNSPTICDEYAKKDDRIKVIHKENGGVSSARNAGLEIAQGEWVTFIDSDDWVEKNYFDILYNNAIKANCDLSLCGINIINEKNGFVKKPKVFPIMVFDRISAKKEFFRGHLFAVYTVCKLVKQKYIYENNITFDTNLKACEDGLFWFEIIDKTDKVLYDSTPCYNYVRNANSSSVETSPKFIDNYMTFFVATKKMINIETNESVVRKIKSFEVIIATWLCSVLLQSDVFVKEKYEFYRKHLFGSLFYYITDNDIKIREKITAILYLFPKVYCFMRKVYHFMRKLLKKQSNINT